MGTSSSDDDDDEDYALNQSVVESTPTRYPIHDCVEFDDAATLMVRSSLVIIMFYNYPFILVFCRHPSLCCGCCKSFLFILLSLVKKIN